MGADVGGVAIPLCPDAPAPAEVPSMPEVHTSPRDPRMSLGPREASASGEKLGGSPQPWGPLGWMLRVGGQVVVGGRDVEEGLTWTKTEGEESNRDIMDLLFPPLSRFQRPVVGTPGAALSMG